ncbi:hypothetical protein [Nostoc sp. 'Peltigera malacea cyanobiont' DB3992]|uniref:hypothetical protein n=1 Tax=Nostoc sp. 'Peltigera malacea cyanobiont' DB3992 TaxID=1206980 RepID=UPI000C041907|nr:hypothetical protein [Nostoc sp. 'Peltigera malacea cyanobiont' DB3992]PHM11647.1 hypothetical protein CK516_01525 [Nostoc sp. 'Peltigera malacea cyanobiont' DB3992]
MEIIVLNLILTAMGYALYLLFVELEKEILRQKQGSQPRKPTNRNNPTSPPSPTVDRSLQLRLFNMLAGDQAACYRLVGSAKAKFPGMPEQWYWERAIEDLIRDRR